MQWPLSFTLVYCWRGGFVPTLTLRLTRSIWPEVAGERNHRKLVISGKRMNICINSATKQR